MIYFKFMDENVEQVKIEGFFDKYLLVFFFGQKYLLVRNINMCS